MKQNKIRNKSRIVRIYFERDYNDEIWLTDWEQEPTPKTHPDAFFPCQQYPYEGQKSRSEKRKSPKTLSKRKIKKRLYQAGVRSNQLSNLTQAILDGKNRNGVLGVRMLGWPIDELKTLLGIHIYRKLTRLVSMTMIFQDEFWKIAGNPSVRSYVQETMRLGRKYNSVPLMATQSLKDFAGDA